MFTITTRDASLLHEVKNYNVPKHILTDSHFLSVLTEMEDEDKDKNICININDEYFVKALEYYQHYSEFFKIPESERTISSEQTFPTNDIPTEQFYIQVETNSKNRKKLLEYSKMNETETFEQKYMNSFERQFIKDFHWISPLSTKYPTENDGVLVQLASNSSGAAIYIHQLSIFRMIEYCGQSGYLGFQSLGRLLSQLVHVRFHNMNQQQIYAVCAL